ncbi:hypothetical protein C922_03529 [Plasmodium inui San Antonio 1]|uniref:CPW-WPC domain-containing protein n=1 Tax=Plasmodium inui San Antonio 1 TaxID=1237626 RepID=W7AAE4_9APIC|nr:hypothetical protein C922_03529 [Plasmodium inui San Antonio 1]EUD66059.1 hypothetical protein C922_03529 [Plasmodium inui San Antonio 1]
MAPSMLFPIVLLLALLGARLPSDSHPFADAGSTEEVTPVGDLNVSGETGQFDDLSHFSRELIEPLSHFLKSVPAAALQEKVKTQVAKAAESLELPNPEEEECEINYAELCPEGWGDWGNGDNCISPASYQGPCKKKIPSFVNSTPREKFNFSIECDVSWPCLHRCSEEDLLEQCPESWTLKGNLCHAPKSYRGKCVRKKIFTHLESAEKKAWAEACDISWPCSKKNYNFDDLCPKDWMPSPDATQCSASSSYIGPCGPVLYVSHLKEVEKRSLMKKCNVEWPVRTNAEGKNVQEKNVPQQVCPLGWTISTSQKRGGGTTCSPPYSYNGPCAQSEEIRNISFDHMSREEKYQLSRRCDFMWHSENEEYQNFELPCPYNWVLADTADHICIAPVEYTHPCNNISSFKGYTHEMKAAWAFRCKAPFINEQSFGGGLLKGKQMGRKSKKGKIVGLNRQVSNGGILLADAPWERDGPIGSVTSNYDRGQGNAATRKEILPNHDESLMHTRGETLPVSEGSTEDHPHEFILSDQKITELLLLKQATKDHELRRNIDDVVQTLRRGHSPRGANGFSFLQVTTKGEKSSRSRKTLHEKLDVGSSPVRKQKKKPLRRGDAEEQSPVRTWDAPLTAEAQNLSEIRKLYRSYQLEKADQSYYEHICFEKNYSECPLGWTKLSGKQCMAPSSYRTNVHKCSSMIDLNEFTKMVYDVAHDMSFVAFDEERIRKLEKKCGLAFPCNDCERDYVQVSCPLGWTETNDQWCEAPADYPPHLKELCGARVNFKYATPLIRRNWSLLCRSDWPCFSPCEKNYAAVCPLGYGLINERLDTASGGIIHVCVNRSWAPSSTEVVRAEVVPAEVGRAEIGRFEATPLEANQPNACLVIEVYNSVEIKKDIERRCRVIWPCLEKCVQDYHQTCPYDWLLKKNNCIAPYHYNPPQGCSKSFAVRSFSSFDKYLFSNKCFAPWPCTNACQQDWSQPCPADWTLLKQRSGKSTLHSKTEAIPLLCRPLKRYMQRGVCTDEYYDLTDFTFLQKQEFSHRCGVRWPCGSSSGVSSPNWQSEKVYYDVGFQRLRTLRFYDTHYASRYAKSGSSFF